MTTSVYVQLLSNLYFYTKRERARLHYIVSSFLHIRFISSVTCNVSWVTYPSACSSVNMIWKKYLQIVALSLQNENMLGLKCTIGAYRENEENYQIRREYAGSWFWMGPRYFNDAASCLRCIFLLLNNFYDTKFEKVWNLKCKLRPRLESLLGTFPIKKPKFWRYWARGFKCIVKKHWGKISSKCLVYWQSNNIRCCQSHTCFLFFCSSCFPNKHIQRYSYDMLYFQSEIWLLKYKH